MIKHFNTAMSAGSSSGSGKGGSGMGTIIWVALIGAAVYFGYKYLTRNNQPVVTRDED
jgi:uncharacterized membrane protein YczE